MQALADGRTRQQSIAAAAAGTPASGGPAPAILHGAVPRVLTADGRLVDDDTVEPLAGAAAAQAAGSKDGGVQQLLPLQGHLTGPAAQPGVTATSAGDRARDALQLAKQRAMALANTLSGRAEHPTVADRSAVAGTASAQFTAATSAAPDDDAAGQVMEANAPPPATASLPAVLTNEVILPQQQQADTASKVSQSVASCEEGALARLLRDYVDDGDDE